MTPEPPCTARGILNRYCNGCDDIRCAAETKHDKCKAQALTALRELVGREVIGTDEPWPTHYDGCSPACAIRHFRIKPSDTEVGTRNVCRSEQRQALSKVFGEGE